MAFVPAVIAGLGALGGLFGNRSSTSKTSGTSNTTGSENSEINTSGASSSNPLFNPQAQDLLNILLGQYGNLSQGTDLRGYQAQQMGDIDHLSEIRKKALESNLAMRGIQGPAAASALNQNENNRFADITKLNQGIPLLQNQLMQQNLGIGQNLFNSIPHGTYNENYGSTESNSTQTQNTQQTGTQMQPGNMLGGLLGGGGNMLALLYGMGSFGGSGTPNSMRLPTQSR